MIKDFGYIDEERCKQLREEYEILTKMLYRLIDRWKK